MDGARRIYSVRAEPLKGVDHWLGRFRSFWEPKLDALAEEVKRGKPEGKTGRPDRLR